MTITKIPQTDPAGGGGGITLTTQDEGVTLSTNVTVLDFRGTGITASGAGSTTTVAVNLERPPFVVLPWAFPTFRHWIATQSSVGANSDSGMGVNSYGNGAAPALVALATTNRYTQQIRQRAKTAASSQSGMGWLDFGTTGVPFKYAWRGNAANLGGFYWNIRFGLNLRGTSTKGFFGLIATHFQSNAIVEPSTGIDMVGIGWDSTDTNVQVMHNDGAGACTKVDLGATNFLIANLLDADILDFELYCAGNGGNVQYNLTKVISAVGATGTLSTNLPTSTVFMFGQLTQYHGAGIIDQASHDFISMRVVTPI